MASQIERKRKFTDMQLNKMVDVMNMPQGKMILEMCGMETQTIIDEVRVIGNPPFSRLCVRAKA